MLQELRERESFFCRFHFGAFKERYAIQKLPCDSETTIQKKGSIPCSFVSDFPHTCMEVGLFWLRSQSGCISAILKVVPGVSTTNLVTWDKMPLSNSGRLLVVLERPESLLVEARHCCFTRFFDKGFQ